MCSISYIRNYLTEQRTPFSLLATIYIYIHYCRFSFSLCFIETISSNRYRTGSASTSSNRCKSGSASTSSRTLYTHRMIYIRTIFFFGSLLFLFHLLSNHHYKQLLNSSQFRFIITVNPPAQILFESSTVHGSSYSSSKITLIQYGTMDQRSGG